MRRALSPSFLAAAGFIECLDAAPDESVTGKEQRNSEREEQTGRHVAYNQRKKERERESAGEGADEGDEEQCSEM